MSGDARVNGTPFIAIFSVVGVFPYPHLAFSSMHFYGNAPHHGGYRVSHARPFRNLIARSFASCSISSRNSRSFSQLTGIRAYQVYLTNERKLAPGSILIAVAALRFLYKVSLHKDWTFEDVIPAPKKPQKLPIVLSPEEVLQFLSSVGNVKHRAILTTCYAAGLRISEAVHLQPVDIDKQRMVIRVDQGKGRKDRYVMLSAKLLETLRSYWRAVRPKGWLFEGDVSGQQFAQDQGHELALTGRQRIQSVLLQVVRNKIVQALFIGTRQEFLHEGVAVGVFDVFENLLAQRPFANRQEPLFEFREVRVAREPGKLRTETLEVAKREFVNDTHEPVKLKQGIL
jgi:hypothetical protein